MSENRFSIADIVLGLKTVRDIVVTDNFKAFVSDAQEDIVIKTQEVDELPQVMGPPLFSNLIFSVYQGTEGYIRRYHDHKDNDRPYAASEYHSAEKTMMIQYLSGDREFFSESQNCFSHIALEELMLRRRRMILHASFVSTELGGVLFSGVSGIGKSTQAGLWEQYEKAVQINGDRPIIGKTKNGWMAYGSPYAGSSGFFLNRRCPIRAIVMLEQGKNCSIVRLPIPIAFQKLYAQTTVNNWNPDFVDQICDLLTMLATEVPVYQLRCTPDLQAVDLLKAELLKGE